jgi:hypothetical protein
MMKTIGAVIGFVGPAWASATQAFDYSTLPHNPQQSRAFVLNMPGDVWLDIRSSVNGFFRSYREAICGSGECYGRTNPYNYM